MQLSERFRQTNGGEIEREEDESLGSKYRQISSCSVPFPLSIFVMTSSTHVFQFTVVVAVVH
jgi:hypothetical protein